VKTRKRLKTQWIFTGLIKKTGIVRLLISKNVFRRGRGSRVKEVPQVICGLHPELPPTAVDLAIKRRHRTGIQ
jgi:hypothetical protein